MKTENLEVNYLSHTNRFDSNLMHAFSDLVGIGIKNGVPSKRVATLNHRRFRHKMPWSNNPVSYKYLESVQIQRNEKNLTS